MGGLRRAVIVLAVLLFLTMLGGAYLFAQIAQQSANLERACVNSRTQLQTRFSYELHESKRFTIGQYKDLFPQIAPDKLERSIKRGRQNLRDLLETYDPRDCDSLYR